MASKALYLFCFALAERAGKLEPELLLVASGELAAVVREVPLEDFEGPEAEEKARDLAWIGPRALAHDGVIRRVFQTSPVLPARYGTLYSSREALLSFLSHHGAAIRSFLHQVDGASEWSVKGLLERVRAQEALVARKEAQEGSLPSSPGLRYLQARRLSRDAAGDVNRWVAAKGAEMRSALSGLAADFRERSPLAVEEAGQQTVFNWAWLVDDRRADELRTAVEELDARYGDHGLALRLSGPFPPYSFTPPLEARAEAGPSEEGA